jgi:hypothetical protein
LENSPSAGPYRKPRADVYTFMLIVSLLAVIVGCLCLYFEMKRFDFKFKSTDVPKPPPVSAAPLESGAGLACLMPVAACDGDRAAV